MIGQALEAAGDDAGADEAYQEVLRVNEFGDVAEIAKKARGQIAERAIWAATPTTERMDAAMYCLSALELFERMTPAEVQQVGRDPDIDDGVRVNIAPVQR